MTRRAWKVGERVFVIDGGGVHRGVVELSDPEDRRHVRVRCVNEDHNCSFSASDVSRDRLPLDLRSARSDLVEAKDAERRSRREHRAASSDLARCVASREKIEKKLAALLARVKP